MQLALGLLTNTRTRTNRVADPAEEADTGEVVDAGEQNSP